MSISVGETRRRTGRPLYPTSALDQANKLVLNEKIFNGRIKTTGLTIDGPTSKDLDDAIWVEKTNSGYLVTVSISDVAALVEQGSELDEEAFKRSFTAYFANYNDPMIPRVLSEDRLSLLEGVPRPTITVSIPLSESCEPGDPDIQLTYLESKGKMHYAQVDSIMKTNSSEYTPMLRTAGAISQRLLARRREKGALAIYDLNKKVKTTEDGQLVPIDDEHAYNANIIIQELMILTNQSVIEFLTKNNVPTLYRNHRARIGAPKNAEFLAEIVDAINNPGKFDLNTLQSRALLSMERARYGRILGGHYALNIPAYTHFTSPIRRYPDLIVHRTLHAFLAGKSEPYSHDELDKRAEHINTIQDEIKDKRAAQFKAATLREASKVTFTFSHTGLSELDTDRFHTALKAACQRADVGTALESEIINRLHAKKLHSRDLFYILLTTKTESESWQNIRVEIIKYLLDNPPDAKSIFMMAVQGLGWQMPSLNCNSTGPIHNLVFTSTGEITTKGKKYTADPCKANTKKLAVQLAEINLLSKIVGCDTGPIDLLKGAPENSDDKPDEAELPLDLPDIAKVGGNPKGDLMMIWQKNAPLGWKEPTFETKRTGGEPHDPIFTSVVRIQIGERIIESDPMIYRGKAKAVEQLASANLIEKLKEEEARANENRPTVETLDTNPRIPLNVPLESIKPDLLPRIRRLILRNRNYSGALTELCQGLHWAHPRWRVEDVSTDPTKHLYDGRVEVTVPEIDKPFFGFHTLSNQQGAKNLASKWVLKKIWFHAFPDDPEQNPIEMIENAGLGGPVINPDHTEDETDDSEGLSKKKIDVVKWFIQKGNCHSALFRLSKDMNWGEPRLEDISLQKESPPKKFKAIVTIDGKEYVEEGKEAPSNTKGKEFAARALLKTVWSVAFPDDIEENPVTIMETIELTK